MRCRPHTASMDSAVSAMPHLATAAAEAEVGRVEAARAAVARVAAETQAVL